MIVRINDIIYSRGFIGRKKIVINFLKKAKIMPSNWKYNFI